MEALFAPRKPFKYVGEHSRIRHHIEMKYLKFVQLRVLSCKRLVLQFIRRMLFSGTSVLMVLVSVILTFGLPLDWFFFKLTHCILHATLLHCCFGCCYYNYCTHYYYNHHLTCATHLIQYGLVALEILLIHTIYSLWSNMRFVLACASTTWPAKPKLSRNDILCIVTVFAVSICLWI